MTQNDDLFEHERVLAEAGFDEEQRTEILNIVNGLITAGLRTGKSLEYQVVAGEFAQVWDILDRRKLPYVKRLANFLSDYISKDEILKARPAFQDELPLAMQEKYPAAHNKTAGYNLALKDWSKAMGIGETE